MNLDPGRGRGAGLQRCKTGVPTYPAGSEQQPVSDSKSAIRGAVIELLNTGESVTIASASLAVGFPIAACYPTVDDVYVDIVACLIDAHVHSQTRPISARRRSANQAFAEDFSAYQTVMVAHAQEHRAVHILILTRPELVVVGPTGSEVTLRELPGLWAQRWLITQAQIQGMTWLQPIPLLAQLVVATLDGILTDHLNNPDLLETNALLELFAYHVAQEGSRNRPLSNNRSGHPVA